jgi:hypothetical protein
MNMVIDMLAGERTCLKWEDLSMHVFFHLAKTNPHREKRREINGR